MDPKCHGRSNYLSSRNLTIGTPILMVYYERQTSQGVLIIDRAPLKLMLSMSPHTGPCTAKSKKCYFSGFRPSQKVCYNNVLKMVFKKCCSDSDSRPIPPKRQLYGPHCFETLSKKWLVAIDALVEVNLYIHVWSSKVLAGRRLMLPMSL